MLQGCLDVDISATPFTNTLPIRRLALQPGSTATLIMAYIAAPQMRLRVAQQRYTCLDATSTGGRYRFESLTQGAVSFTAELPVDGDGLVLDYPNLFRRTGHYANAAYSFPPLTRRRTSCLECSSACSRWTCIACSAASGSPS